MLSITFARPAAVRSMHSVPIIIIALGFKNVGFLKSPVMIEGSIGVKLYSLLPKCVMIGGALVRCSGLSMNGARCEM